MAVDRAIEMTELRRSILSMAADVEQRVQRAVDALLDADIELAEEVRRGDAEIDQMEIDIEHECLRLLALTQPVASDLRFVLAVMRINADLERIGDHAKSIAKRAIDLYKQTPIDLPRCLSEMAASARAMLTDSVAALAREDAQLCRGIRNADEQVDDLLKEVFAWVQEQIPRQVEATRAAIDVLSVARKLERIGDLATNIAEEVVFLVEGAVIRHTKG